MGIYNTKMSEEQKTALETEKQNLKYKSAYAMTTQDIFKLDEKELLAKNVALNIDRNKKLDRIISNVVFFFWIAIIQIILFFIGFMEIMDSMK